jgi:hypothetical protein
MIEAATKRDKKGGGVDFGEHGISDSRFIEAMPWAENPNKLIERHGLELVDNMMTDETMKSASKMISLAVIAPGGRIDPPKNDHPKAQEATEFVRWVFDELPGTFRSVEKNTLSGRDRGYSLQELNWGTVTSGQWAGKFAYKSIKPYYAKDYRFKLDEHGNVLGITHVEDIGDTEILKMDKWLHYAHDAGSVAGSPYGCPQIIPAYPFWKARWIAFRYRGMWVERYASQNPVLKAKRSALANPVEYARLKAILKSLVAGTGVIVDDETETEFWGSSGSGHLEFGRFDEMCQRGMMRGQLVPTQLGLGPETNTGSRAKAQVHENLLKWVITDMDTDVTTMVSEQAIRRLCDPNFELDGGYPVYVRNTRDLDDALEIVATIGKAYTEGIWGELDIETVNRVHRLVGVKEISEEEWTERVHDKKNALAGPKGEDGEDLPGRKKIEEPKRGARVSMPNAPEQKPKVEPPVEAGMIITYGANWNQALSAAELAGPAWGRETPATIERGRKPNSKYMRDLTEYEQAAGLKPHEVVRFYDSVEAEGVKRISAAMTIARDQLIKKLGRNGLLDGSATRAELMRFGGMSGTAKKQFADTVYATELTAFLQGARFAHGWVKEAAGRDFSVEVEDRVEFDAISGSGLLDPRAVREYFSGLLPMSAVAAEGMKAEAFWITGLYLEDHGTMLASTKHVIDMGFRSKEWQRVEGQVGELFDEWIGSGRLTATGQQFTSWHAHTVVRNAIARSFNAGMYQLYHTPGAQEWVEAYQWSSILDDRVTPHCEVMDEVVFLDGQVIWPPAHHLCRSMVMAILKGQRYRVETLDNLARWSALRDPAFTSGVPIYV